MQVWKYETESSETLEKVSVSTPFAQSRWVSVSTSTKTPSLRWVSVLTSSKFHGLDESRSRHLSNLPVSMSLGLNTFEISAGVRQRSRGNHILGHFWSKNGPKCYQKVSVSTTFISLDWNCSLGLNLRLWILKSRSRIWDFRNCSLSLEFETLDIRLKTQDKSSDPTL